MTAELAERPVDSETAVPLPAVVEFYARGYLQHAISGLGLGGMMLVVAVMMWADAMAGASAAPNAIALGVLAAGPLLIGLIGLLLAGIGVLHGLRLNRTPLAFRMDREGVTGFLLFARRRMAWKDITQVIYRGAWIHLHAGRKKMFINTTALRAVDGHDPGALIDYFLKGLLGAAPS
jgi:hypothetical protein